MEVQDTSAAIIASAYADRPAIAWKSYIDGVYATVQWGGHRVNVKIAADRDTRYTDFEDEDPNTEYYAAIAEVSIAGETIGYDALYGIGVDPGVDVTDDPYLAIECIWGCVDQAIAGIPVHLPAVRNKLSEQLEALKIKMDAIGAAIANIDVIDASVPDRNAYSGYPMLTSLYCYYPCTIASRAARVAADREALAASEADPIAPDIYFRDPPRA